MPPSLHGRSHTACLRCMGRSPRGSSPRAPGRMHVCPPPFCTGQRLSSQGRNAFSRSTRSAGIITKNVRKCKGLCDGGEGERWALRAPKPAPGPAWALDPSWRTSLNTLSSIFRQFGLWLAAKSRLGAMKNPTAVWYEQARPAICRIFRDCFAILGLLRRPTPDLCVPFTKLTCSPRSRNEVGLPTSMVL